MTRGGGSLCDVRGEEYGDIKSCTCGGCADTQPGETWSFNEKSHDLRKGGGFGARSTGLGQVQDAYF